MVTTSKRWAILGGLMIVASGIILDMVWSHSRETAAIVSSFLDTIRREQSAEPPVARLADPVAQPKAVAAAPAPHFDVVRVEPDGSTVVAGQAAPNSTVDLLVSGSPVARAQSDASGYFAILPPVLGPGAYALTLRQSGDGPAQDSAQSVAVSVPEKGKGAVVVALQEPGKPVRILAAPVADATAAGAKAVAPTVVIRSVELENGNTVFASGAAPAGTTVRLYLDNDHIADAVAGPDAKWTVKIKHALNGGHYTVRADAAPDGSSVTARAEVPFDVPVQTAIAAATPVAKGVFTRTHAAKRTRTARAPIARAKTAIVHNGDSLWDISRIKLGDGARYTRLYAANSAQIRKPGLIYPGQVFLLPKRAN